MYVQGEAKLNNLKIFVVYTGITLALHVYFYSVVRQWKESYEPQNELNSNM